MGLVLVVGAWLPAVSRADAYPAFGEQSSGSDAITHDCPTATGGGEPVDSCAALADRLSSVRWRLGAVHDSLRAGLAGIGDQLDTLAGLPDDVALTNTRLLMVHDDLVQLHDDLAATSGGAPTTATVALSSTDRSTIEDAQGSLHADVWFLAGLLAALLAAFQLRSVFRA